MESSKEEAASIMVDNVHVENTSPVHGVKRKAEADKDETPTSTPTKTTPTDKKEITSVKKAKRAAPTSKGPLLDLKKRRILLKQDTRPTEAVLRHDSYVSLLRDFHTYMDELSGPLDTWPDQFEGLVILAGHESSAATQSTLTKTLRTLFEKPSFDFGESQGPSSASIGAGTISTSALSTAISKTLTQTSFGFTPADISPSSTSSSAPPAPKLPQALQYTRWEASPALRKKYFPEQAQALMQGRFEERLILREECESALEGLNVEERLEVLGLMALAIGKGTSKQKERRRDSSIEILEAVPNPTKIDVALVQRNARTASNSKERSLSPVKRAAKAKKPEDEETRKKREEKEAKKTERDNKLAEKQAAKDHAERQKEKQKQTMASFFGKPSAEASSTRQMSPVKAAAISNKSDYERTFLPFSKKADVELAPVNWFAYRDARRRRRQSSPEKKRVIAVDELQIWDTEGAEEVKSWDAKDFLKDHLNRFPKIERRQLPEGLKSAPPDVSVRDVWEAHIDAELSGIQDPRKVLEQLNDRERFPWKTLLFEGQKRPPYSGTFTKRSAVVGPRTPFAQDPIFEYGYDSDEEWEDAGGDDVEEQPKDDAPEEEDDLGSEEEGEFDDWLDDSEYVVPASPGSDDIQMLEPDGTVAPAKPVKKERIVKRVQKLPVIVKGPVWETCIGEEGTDGLEAFRIQLLNDAPCSIDPFTWLSGEVEQKLTAQKGMAVVGLSKKVPCLFETKSTPPTVVRQSPSKAAPASSAPSTTKASSTSKAHSTTNGEATVNKLKPRPSGPKIAFPDAYLSEMLRLVDGCDKSQADLSALLRIRFETITTKLAIETKLKEVASKARTKGSKWVVNPEAWTIAQSYQKTA